MTVSAILYAVLASGETQEWNYIDIIKTQESPHSEHAALHANMSKVATMSDDYGASNRGGLRASELDSRSEVESSFDTEPNDGESEMAHEEENQWIKFKAQHAHMPESESDETVPIGVPAVRSRTNTLERPKKTKKENDNDEIPLKHEYDHPPESYITKEAYPIIAQSSPVAKIKPVTETHQNYMSEEFPMAQDNGKLQYGWRDVLMAELGPGLNEPELDLPIQPMKPKRFKRDLIDLGSFENEDRDDSGMATEASATSSNLNSIDDKGWKADPVRNIPLDLGQFNVPTGIAYGDNNPNYMDGLLQLGASRSSTNVCLENLMNTTGVHSAESTSSSLDKKSIASMSRQTQTEISLGPSEHSSLSKSDDIYADSAEEILDSETSIPLESDGEPLVTRI